MASVNQSLARVQSRLKAPKGQYNSFGKYRYRSCEDILEAVKPLLSENGLLLTMSDEVVMTGGRFYVRATATVTSAEDGGAVSVSAFAREEDEKKGMDGSQITGSASSYARKYALNGLFAIDDTKDADTMNVSEEYTVKPARKEDSRGLIPADRLEDAALMEWLHRKMSAGGQTVGAVIGSRYRNGAEDIGKISSAYVEYKINNNL